jgi:hypothetical protein
MWRRICRHCSKSGTDQGGGNRRELRLEGIGSFDLRRSGSESRIVLFTGFQ